MRKQKFTAFLLFLILMLSGCKKNIQRPAFPKNIPGSFSILYSGDLQGNIEPCGCKSAQVGGLAKQSQIIIDHRKSIHMLFDAGNTMSSKTTQQELLKWFHVMEIYEKMGYDAINLGKNELKLPLSYISQMIRKSTTPIISCNVASLETNELIAKPSIIKSVYGLKVGIIGVVGEVDNVGRGLLILAPEKALEKHIEKIAQKVNLIVLLANMSDRNIKKLVDTFPEIDIILSTGIANSSYKKIGKTIISNITTEGKSLELFRFAAEEKGGLQWGVGRQIQLTPTVKDHKGTVHIIQKYKKKLSGKRLYLRDLRETKRYAGPQKCAECHEEAYEKWTKSKHFKSIECLKEKNNQHDPHCLKCHVTGLRSRYGYKGEEQTPHLARVTCESCHGPSAKHAFHDSDDELPPAPSNPNPKKMCLECHNWEHSDHFSFKEFWEKIKH